MKSIEEYYWTQTEYGTEIHYHIGKSILNLLIALRKTPDPRVVFGRASWSGLDLLADDDVNAQRLVHVCGIVHEQYHIEYRMPSHAAPWDDASVRGITTGIDNAIQMIFIAMDRSEGWR